MKARVRYPLLLTRCEGCYRRRTCAFLPILQGYKHPLCRQCIQRVEGACFGARLDLQRQGR